MCEEAQYASAALLRPTLRPVALALEKRHVTRLQSNQEGLMGIRSPCRLFGSRPLDRGRNIAAILGLALLCSVPAAGRAGAEDVPLLDEKLAGTVLPYAKMACDSYFPCRGGELAGSGYIKDIDWKTAMHREGHRDRIVSMYEKAGFSATIYRNDRTKEIVIAYRGTVGTAREAVGKVLEYEYVKLKEKLRLDTTARLEGDWPTNVRAHDLKTAAGKLEAQYVAARILANGIGRAYAGTPYAGYKVTLTGHSLGGGLASYAGHYATKADVYTFDPARNVLAGTGSNPRQINIITKGDPVSDPRAILGSRFGSTSYLPGRTVRIDFPASLNPIKKVTNHFPNALLERISATAEGKGRTSALPTPLPSASWTALKDRPGVDPSSSTVRSPPPPSPPRLSDLARPSPPPAPPPSRGPTTIVMRAPGGISLNRAAAERMAIDLDLDGAWYRDGKLVLSGRKSAAHTLDAALMMTAFRAACESGDPYFSLDPDNGAAWSEEGHKASDELWRAISGDVGWNAPVRATRKAIKERSLQVRSIWARRDYPQLWSKVSSAHPNLRSKLVFRPVWLNETRFGEILYQADVLLKELASGTSVLKPGALRAAKVGGYVSQANRTNAKNLLATLRGEKIKTQWQGSRFWFDVTPRGADRPIADAPAPASSGDRDLLAALRGRGMIPPDRPLVHRVRNLVKDNQALDLTNVYPTMFVRRRDMVKEVDIPDDDPIMNAFSADINDNVEKYVAQYKELQALTEAIRAYVVAIHVIKNNNSVCRQLAGAPLLDSEKATRPLPPYHPSELMIAIARYQYGDGRRSVRAQAVRSVSIQGGVSIAGKTFYSTVALASTPTDVTRLIKLAAEADKPPEPKKDEDRRYLFLAVDLDAAAAR